MSDLDKQRFNMIEQQIRPWNVLDDTVLSALFAVKREQFVPANAQAYTFVDMEAPIGEGQVMLQPKIEARILELLQIKPSDKVLEIGTGTGYQAALLAHFAAQVTTIEITPSLAAQAQANLQAAGIQNVQVQVGDGAQGWANGAPYDVIVVSASLPDLPNRFKEQLAIGGRLFVILGDAPVMTAWVITRTSEQAFSQESFFETMTAPLQNAKQPERFVF